MKEEIYKFVPNFFQNILISLFNFMAYRVRYGGKYWEYRKEIKDRSDFTFDELEAYQAQRYKEFINQSILNSKFYSNKFQGIKDVDLLENIKNLPIVTKEDLRKNIQDVYTVSKNKAVVSKTGGTTGKSLEVLFTKDNMQERFAMLDDFRAKFGYSLGKKTAWFSGKNLLTERDISKNRFWKQDYFYKVKYYSTFHIKNDYLKYYVNDLIKFSPEYLVGFPSSILEIAKYGLANNIDFPEHTVKAIFPTAETISNEMRLTIERFFKSKIYNQYASSEGAPFITECVQGNLHIEMQSGVFEIFNPKNPYSNEGELVFTSFTTVGTPLIRYNIGDSLILEEKSKKCNCGNNNPLVKEILGRVDDYIYSPENGKINLGNISNTLKDVKGIVKFQVVQNKLNEIELLVVKDDKEFSTKYKDQFLRNWIDRVGHNMIININYMDEIAVEKSGKFRMVKNNIKSQIDSN